MPRNSEPALDEAQVIELLRSVGDSGPPLRDDPAVLLALGRRARWRLRRRQTAAAGLLLAGVAASVAVLAPRLAIDGTRTFSPAGSGVDAPAATAPTPAPAGSGVDAPTPPGPSTSPSLSAPLPEKEAGPRPMSDQDQRDAALLVSALGADFAPVDPDDTPILGALALVRPDSAAAVALPAGYTAGANIMRTSGTETIEEFCEPMWEKGTSTTGCSEASAPSGHVVRVQQWDTPMSAPGTWAQVRVMAPTSGTQFVIADLWVWETAGTTADRRAQAQQWLDARTDQMVSAATQAAGA